MSELSQKPDEFYEGQRLGAEDLNKLLRAIPRSITGDGVNIKRYSDRLVVDNNPLHSGEIPVIQTFVVLEEFDDYLKCISFAFAQEVIHYSSTLGDELAGGVEDGAVVFVAKPNWFQKSMLDGLTAVVNGVETVYTYTENVGERTLSFSDPGQDDITETLTPSYYVGAIISAYAGPTGLNGQADGDNDVPIYWTDLNEAGRRWTKLHPTQYFVWITNDGHTGAQNPTETGELYFTTNNGGFLDGVSTGKTVRWQPSNAGGIPVAEVPYPARYIGVMPNGVEVWEIDVPPDLVFGGFSYQRSSNDTDVDQGAYVGLSASVAATGTFWITTSLTSWKGTGIVELIPPQFDNTVFPGTAAVISSHHTLLWLRGRPNLAFGEDDAPAFAIGGLTIPAHIGVWGSDPAGNTICGGIITQIGDFVETVFGGLGGDVSTFPSGATPISDGTPGDPFVAWVPSGIGPPDSGQGALNSTYIDRTDPNNPMIYFKS